MPNINLVAARREEKRAITTLSRQLFMGLVASGVALFGAVVWFGIITTSQSIEKNRLDVQLGELQPKIERIKQRESDIAALKPRVDTLDNARLSTLRWQEFLRVLAEATPDTVYYTSVTTSGDSTSPTVNIKGFAPSQNIVGTVAQRLSNSGNSMFSDVEITQTSNGSAPEDPVQKVTFDMNLYLRPVSFAEAVPVVPTTPATVPTGDKTGVPPATGTAASAAQP